MSDEESWTEVKPRERKSLPADDPTTPPSPRARIGSFGEIDLTAEKARKSRSQMKESKLEWSATKRREREIKVNARQEQRERTIKVKESVPSSE